MTLRPRLAMSHGIIFGFLCLISLVALQSIKQLAERTDLLVAANVDAMDATERIRQQLGLEIAALMQDMISARNNVPREPVASNPSIDVRAAINEARSYFTKPDEIAALQKFEQDYVHFSNSIEIWRANRLTQGDELKLPANYDDMRQALVELRAVKNGNLRDVAHSARAYANDTFTIVGILALLTALIALFTTLRLVRSMITPVDQLTDIAQRIGLGDFGVSFRAGSIDEFNQLGRHFEATGKSLRLFRDLNLERIIVEQRRTQAVLESIGEGLVIFNEDGEIERINGVAERQLGVLADYANGRGFEKIGDAKVGARVREVIATGTFADADEPELRIARDGENRILNYSVHRFVESESGRPGAVMVMRDVTARREFDKMRSDFVMRASHELRTPITSIRMGLGLLGETLLRTPGSRDAELYDTVTQEVERMTGLLADLLDLSRLRAGEQSMERTPTKLEDLLIGARGRFALAAREAQVEIDLDLATTLPRLSLCRSAFERVLDNLIANALRHTPSGGNVTLSAQRTPLRVAISVSDTGEGIPHAQQALIFQPFVQIGKKRGGAGLGLAICQEIVQQHGGEIQVASLPGRGTTFTILLPPEPAVQMA